MRMAKNEEVIVLYAIKCNKYNEVLNFLEENKDIKISEDKLNLLKDLSEVYKFVDLSSIDSVERLRPKKLLKEENYNE